VVGPSLNDAARDDANRRLKLGFVALVAVSAGLVAFRANASPLALAGALLAGTVLGVALLWFIARWGREFRRQR
jgi:lysozyme family protein